MNEKKWKKLKPSRKKEILKWREIMEKIPKIKVNPKKRPKTYSKSKPTLNSGLDIGKPIKNYWDKFPK
jgi:hypothetical protein